MADITRAHTSERSDQANWAGEIAAQLRASADVVARVANDEAELLARIASLLVERLEAGGTLFLCGNGGSSADAMHVATELLARYKVDRRALRALALGVDPTFVSAWSNDVAFERVFARQLEGLARRGDVLWCFSTSGNSPNVIQAARTARALGLATLGFTGAGGGQLRDNLDLWLCVPSADTPRVQEAHMAAAHVLCDLIERAFAA
ncbi:MAG: D-sedoheptulose-7-phosphate isomerase [Chloroflexota bacterium]